jgi:predicted ATPase
VLIREQLTQEGGALPWGDLGAFAQECSDRMRVQLQQCRRAERCFFDRGLPDLIGYLSHGGRKAPDAWRAASRGYARTVFFAPPWRDIYVNDPERPQTFAEAQALSAHIRLAYRDCGFRLIDLEKASVGRRVQQVLHFIDTNYQRVLVPWVN